MILEITQSRNWHHQYIFLQTSLLELQWAEMQKIKRIQMKLLKYTQAKEIFVPVAKHFSPNVNYCSSHLLSQNLQMHRLQLERKLHQFIHLKYWGIIDESATGIEFVLIFWIKFMKMPRQCRTIPYFFVEQYTLNPTVYIYLKMIFCLSLRQ